jgi:hypothetical protein
MASFTKRDDCIWFGHLSSDLQGRLSHLAESESVSLKLNGHRTIWSRMRNGPHGPTPGIRITEGIDVWRSIPRGAEFSLEIQTEDEAERVTAELFAAYDNEATRPSVMAREVCLFGEYIFADYSGAAADRIQKKAIRVAYTQRQLPPALVSGSFTRESLVEWMHQKLLSASQKGLRLCLGQDHSYGIPLGLAKELGVDGQPWRSAIAAFLDGTYAADAPSFSDVPRSLGRSMYGFVLGVLRIISGRQLSKVIACHQGVRAQQRVEFARASLTLDEASSDVVHQCLLAESEITVQLAASHFGESACCENYSHCASAIVYLFGAGHSTA